MVAGWIYPHRDRCGIARYSSDYAGALSAIIPVFDIDPRWWITDRKRFHRTVSDCTLIHVQYDTAVYLNGHADFYLPMLHGITVPVVVSLHEIYDEHPFVFPRSQIGGKLPSRALRTIVWDLRHPVEHAFARHLAKKFGATRILVHHDYHRRILAGKGVPEPMVTTLPLPLYRTGAPVPYLPDPLRPLRIGAHGFIQQAYDYDLLFDTLNRLSLPWTFTWIGGVRTPDQQHLLDMITGRVREAGWSGRFHITGWIDEQDIGRRLADVDLILALFATRSSSASIARTLSFGKAVIAAELPLTREIAQGNRYSHQSTAAPIITAPADPAQIAARIGEFATDGVLRMRLYEAIAAYVDEHSFDIMAGKLYILYRELCGK